MVPARERFKKEITLLSKGFSMRDKIPGGKITVFPWDQSIDDWVIKNLKKINLATLPFEIVKRLVNLDKIDDLPSGDVSTILLVAKALSRDSVVQYTAVCPACGHKEPTQIIVPDQLEKVAEKPDDYPGYDDVTLPACKDVVRIRPLLVRDEFILSKRPENDPIPRRMARIIQQIVSVNDGQPDSVDEAVTYLRALQPSDLDYLIDQSAVLEAHLGTELKHKCDSCGTEHSHNLSLDSEFFR